MSTQKLVGENALSAIATDIKTALGAKANASDLATVATSGSYNDLSNKPSIPTKVSDLTNDSDFQTGDEVDASIATAIANKADIDGEYDLMVVGNAKQLKSNVGENDKVPYLFRTSGGYIDIGDREEDTIVGGTVAFNQLVQNGNFESTSGWTAPTGTFSASDNIGFFTPTEQNQQVTHLCSFVANHKYLISIDITLTTSTNKVYLRCIGENRKSTDSTTSKQRVSTIINSTLTSNNSIGVRDERNSDFDTIKIENCICIDLTQLFGSTIADYIYTLESGTPGAGVAWFRNLFPKSYYAYNAGELISVKTSAHITRGFNAWDEVWEYGSINDTTGQNEPVLNHDYWRAVNYIKIVPNTAYCHMTDGYNGNFRHYFYDADKNFIKVTAPRAENDKVVFTTPANAYYMRFRYYTALTNYKNCINLSWDGERDGEYEPYVEHEYPLDSDLELRGIPKLDANNKLYYDGDTYESDGSVTRKYGIVDLGSLNWYYQTSGSQLAPFFYAYKSDIKSHGAVGLNDHNVFCSKYPTVRRNGIDFVDKSIAVDGTVSDIQQIQIKDSSYTDATALKNSLNGVYFIYEKVTSTEESAEPFTNPQLVDDFGTEEYVDTRAVPIPVGHDTFYQANLRAKLEMSPDSPSGNGDYIVRQTDGQNEYVALTKELPSLPSTDGTYTLKCTVSSGTASLSWVADE